MNGNGDAENQRWLTRPEEFVEVLANEHVQFAEEHRRLLTAQVVLTDRLTKLADAQAQTEDRLSVLMRMMDDWIRRQT